MANYLSYYPEATLDDAQSEFCGLGGYKNEQVEMVYEDVRSLYF